MENTNLSVDRTVSPARDDGLPENNGGRRPLWPREHIARCPSRPNPKRRIIVSCRYKAAVLARARTPWTLKLIPVLITIRPRQLFDVRRILTCLFAGNAIHVWAKFLTPVSIPSAPADARSCRDTRAIFASQDIGSVPQVLIPEFTIGRYHLAGVRAIFNTCRRRDKFPTVKRVKLYFFIIFFFSFRLVIESKCTGSWFCAIIIENAYRYNFSEIIIIFIFLFSYFQQYLQ